MHLLYELIIYIFSQIEMPIELAAPPLNYLDYIQ